MARLFHDGFTGERMALRRWLHTLSAKLGRPKYLVLLDTTNGCNLRCTFCTRDNAKIQQMTTPELDCILGKLRGHISSLQLSCAWEYSVARNAAGIVRMVGKYRIPSTSIYTNGNILTDEIAEALIEARLNDFVVSIGETKRETYENLRRGGSFERVIANVKKLAALKEERNSPLPLICANLTVVNSNIAELPDFVELAHSIGIGRIVGRHLILNKGLDMSLETISDKARANEIIDAAEARARAIGMEFSVPRYHDVAEPRNCRAPWGQLYIGSNGDVSVCPRIHLYAKLGNLLEESFESVIEGKEMKSLKQQFSEGRFENPVCQVCMAGLETELPIEQGF